MTMPKAHIFQAAKAFSTKKSPCEKATEQLKKCLKSQENDNCVSFVLEVKKLCGSCGSIEKN